MRHSVVKAILCAVLLAPVAALADTELTDRATGAVYVLTTDTDGALVLASKVDESDTFRLREACIVEHPIYGVGVWKQDARGWTILMQGSKIVSFDGPPPQSKKTCLP